MVGLIESCENHLRTSEVVGAGLGEGHSTRAARQERHPDLLFKSRNDSGRRRLRHAHLAPRDRETAAASDPNKKLHGGKAIIHTETAFYGDTRPNRLAQQLVRHRIVVLLDLDVVVEPDPA